MERRNVEQLSGRLRIMENEVSVVCFVIVTGLGWFAVERTCETELFHVEDGEMEAAARPFDI